MRFDGNVIARIGARSHCLVIAHKCGASRRALLTIVIDFVEERRDAISTRLSALAGAPNALK